MPTTRSAGLRSATSVSWPDPSRHLLCVGPVALREEDPSPFCGRSVEGQHLSVRRPRRLDTFRHAFHFSTVLRDQADMRRPLGSTSERDRRSIGGPRRVAIAVPSSGQVRELARAEIDNEEVPAAGTVRGERDGRSNATIEIPGPTSPLPIVADLARLFKPVRPRHFVGDPSSGKRTVHDGDPP